MVIRPDRFVHLHVASGYSLRHGASTPAALVARAVELGQDTLALTDRDGLYGAVRFALACREQGVAPVLGVDLAVTPTGLLPAPPVAPRRRAVPTRGGAQVDSRGPRVVMLARNGRGWAALCRLVSQAHLTGRRGAPVLTDEMLLQYAADGDVVVLLGPDSECGRAVAGRRPDIASAVLRHWRDIVGSANVRAEIVCHRTAVPDVDPSRPWVTGLSLPVAARFYRWAIENGVQPVLTNAVRHAEPEQSRVVDVLDSIRRLVPLDARHLDRGNGAGFLKSAGDMVAIAEEVVAAAGYPDPGLRARRWVAQTVRLGDECVLDPVTDLGIGSVHVPELAVLGIGDPDPGAADRILRHRCEAELPRRYGPRSAVSAAEQRLSAELDVISRMGFAGYFLTVADVVDLIREVGVRVAARGSGAGSLVNHLLGISGVDPLAHGLLMERFLSPLRRALPDIDIDVESARRTEIYERIMRRFGGERCACVSMMDTYRVRHAIRDVGAALAYPAAEVDAFAKAFPHIAARDARVALAELPELRDSGLGRLAATGRLDVFLDLVQSLDGLPRHIALHPCGVLLSDTSMLDRTPVEASWQGFPMSQFDKDDVEELGFLKLDVLGIRMQSAMAHAVTEIRRTTGVEVDVDAVDRADAATFELIRSSRTLGCFQIESPGQRELLGKFAPESFADLIIDISLFRPGPVKSDMITPFLRARHGWQEAEYLHPDLEEVLAETAGVVVFHEQVIRMISVVTGCTLAQADEARRTLGTGDGQRRVREWLYPAALARGYDLAVIEEVWDVLAAFASFGFCKAHAAAFALPTYQSAWLKAHHPAAFLAGVLTHDPGMYPKRLILDDARHHGVEVLGLDVNRSTGEYRVESVGPDRWGVRIPVSEVSGISDAEVAAVVAARPYRSLTDLWHRSGASRPIVERMILAGGLDRLHSVGGAAGVGRVTRRDLLLHLADLDRYSHGGATARRRSRSQPANPADPAEAARGQSLAPAPVVPAEERPSQLTFDLAPDAIDPSGLPEMNPGERVRAEVEILGLDVSSHLVSFYDDLLRDIGVLRSDRLLTCRSDAEILVAGVKVATQTPPVRSGRRVVFLTLDDGVGPVDATFFEDAQGPYAATLFHSWLLLVRGHVRRTGPRGVSVRATGCWELGAVRQLWLDEGAGGVHHLLAQSGPVTAGGVGTVVTARGAGSAGGMGQRRRVLVHASGFRVSPYSDVAPAGVDPRTGPPADGADPPGKLWHSSPGSPGR